MKNNRFRNVGFGPTYNCFCCGRRTRYTGGEAGNCLECYEIAGLDNSVNDNGYKPGTKEYADARKEADRLLAIVAKRGGNVERVKKMNDFIWGEDVTDKNLIGGMTREELARAIAMAAKAFDEHVAKTGVDPLAEFYDGGAK